MNFTLSKSNLNLKVYTTPSKPTAPGAENDIAVISSVPMTNWIMSPEKPSGIPRNDGDVWIRYSTSGGTRNILKQNTLMIATIFAWQYVDGAWVSREAASCQGGKWVDWIQYLLRKNNLYAGWSVLSPVSFVRETKGIRITRNGSFGYCYYSEMVDIRSYNTVNIKFSECTSTVGVQLCIGKKLFTSEADEIGYAESAKGLQSGSLTIDLSTYKSYGTVSIGIGVHGGNGSILAEEVWFE